MFNGFCDFGNWGWGSLGNFGVMGWIGLILNLIFWVGLIAVLILLVVWATRRARVPEATVSLGSGQPTNKVILQTRYAKGEITREQYKLMKEILDKPND